MDNFTLNTPEQQSDTYQTDVDLLTLLLQDDNPLPSKQQQQQHRQLEYISTTLKDNNIDRCLYLPCFPHMKSSNIKSLPLLLANASTLVLGSNNLIRRYATYYDGPFVPTVMSGQIDSFLMEFFKENFYDLIERLKVNVAIFDFNLRRFKNIVQRFQLVENIFYRHLSRYEARHLLKGVRSFKQIQSIQDLDKLSLAESGIGTEFFLQIDVDLFYMKTCSFRGAYPRSLDEGLFCKSTLPQSRYSFQPCEQIICSLCDPSISSAVQFNCYQPHRFLNSYHSILNSPATCQTTNIIYALTCPCGEYDFVGSTSTALYEVLENIYQYGNRFIHETLLSAKSFYDLQHDSNHFLNDYKEKFRLFQHSARCSKIIQLFLDANPQYDCVIPMTYDEAVVDDTNYIQQCISKDDDIEYLIQNLPKPPSGYTFSKHQRHQQRLLFQNLNQRNTRENFFNLIHLYRATVIAVLPEDCSTLLRRVLECLFSTHAETKLNMYNLRTTNTEQLYGEPYHRTWCENITRPSDIIS